MKEHPILFSAPMVQALLADRKHVTRRLSRQWLKVKAGDRLWVKECYGIAGAAYMIDPCLNYRADGAQRPLDPSLNHMRPQVASAFGKGWKPSIHMPRWASRILLQAEEDARVERLQDITEEDAIAEGVDQVISDQGHIVYRAYGAESGNWCYTCPVDSFRSLWSSLHTNPGERFADNPEVVRVGRFERVLS